MAAIAAFTPIIGAGISIVALVVVGTIALTSTIIFIRANTFEAIIVGTFVVVVAIGIHRTTGITAFIIIVTTETVFTNINRTGVSIFAIVVYITAVQTLATDGITSITCFTICIAGAEERSSANTLLAVLTSGVWITVVAHHAVRLEMTFAVVGISITLVDGAIVAIVAS